MASKFGQVVLNSDNLRIQLLFQIRQRGLRRGGPRRAGRHTKYFWSIRLGTGSVNSHYGGVWVVLACMMAFIEDKK